MPPASSGPRGSDLHGHDAPSLFVASLAEIDLRPGQKDAIEAVVEDLRRIREPSQEAVRNLAQDVNDGIAAGELDQAKIDADIEGFVQAVDARKPRVQEAMNRLHATLDRTQRTKLIQTMRTKVEAIRDASSRRATFERERGAPRKQLAEELALTSEQQEQIRNRLREQKRSQLAETRDTMHGTGPQMKGIGDAFESEAFEAKAAGVAEHSGEMARAMVISRIRFIEVVLSVLVPDQRIKFVDHMKANADEME